MQISTIERSPRRSQHVVHASAALAQPMWTMPVVFWHDDAVWGWYWVSSTATVACETLLSGEMQSG
jgi:hypothetical protein